MQSIHFISLTLGDMLSWFGLFFGIVLVLWYKAITYKSISEVISSKKVVL